jgi:hypothetical protein
MFAAEADAAAAAAAGVTAGGLSVGGPGNAAVASAMARSLARSHREIMLTAGGGGGGGGMVGPSPGLGLLGGGGPAGAAGDNLDDAAPEEREALNERAVAVIRRISAKLTGRDFAEDDAAGRLMAAGVGAGSTDALLPIGN